MRFITVAEIDLFYRDEADFSHSEIVTIAEFRLLTGHFVKDTQTGLRGIPLALVPRLLDISGNRTSHYRPLADTFSMQRALFAEVLTARFGS